MGIVFMSSNTKNTPKKKAFRELDADAVAQLSKSARRRYNKQLREHREAQNEEAEISETLDRNTPVASDDTESNDDAAAQNNEEEERLAKEAEEKKLEEERLAKEEEERLAREEEERVAREIAERLAKEQAEREAQEERLAKEAE